MLSVFLGCVLASASVRSQNVYFLFFGIGIFLFLWFTLLKKTTPPRISLLVFLLLLVQCSLMAVVEGKDARTLIATEPKNETYTSDGLLYLKTFYLMHKGQPFYLAFDQAYDLDHRSSGHPPDLWGFRSPAIYYLWSLLPFGNGIALAYAFMGYTLLLLTVVYWFGKSLVGPRLALIVPYLLMPYLLYGATTYEFLQMEWWGILPMIGLIAGVYFKKPFLIVCCGLGAPLIREVYALSVLALGGVTLCLPSYRFLFKWFVVVGIAYSGFLLFHASHVFSILPFSWPLVLNGRQHELTLGLIYRALAYGSWRYAGAPYRLFSLYALLLTVTGGFVWVKRPLYRPLLLILAGSFAFTLLTFLKIGLYPWGDYWGIMIGPLLIFTLGLVCALALKLVEEKP